MYTRKIEISCLRCNPKPIGSKSIRKYTSISEEMAFIDTCPQGHKNIYLIQNFKFEILLDMAIEAMYAQYYREAIFNFASAQERFFEFVIELFCIENKINKEEYVKTWGFIKKQSERQLGAFLFLYLNQFKETFILETKFVELRNDIIHKGIIPNKEEATWYGNYVLQNIYKIIKKIKVSVKEDSLMQLTTEKLSKQHDCILKKHPDYQESSTTTMLLGCVSGLFSKDVKDEMLDVLIPRFATYYHHINDDSI
jgi:hypothetical protein